MNEAVDLDDGDGAPPPRRRKGARNTGRRTSGGLRAVPDRVEADDAPTMTWEIRTVDGIEGERLGAQQARVMWEVTQWLALNKS